MEAVRLQHMEVDKGVDYFVEHLCVNLAHVQTVRLQVQHPHVARFYRSHLALLGNVLLAKAL